MQRSSELRLDVTWARRSSIALSLNYPLRYAFRGVTRPRSDHVDLSAAGAPPLPYSVDDPALVSVLAEVRARALWLRRFTTPLLRCGRSATEAWATLAARLDPANSVIG